VLPIWLLPWLLLALAVPFSLRRRPRVSDCPAPAREDSPLVSIIVPARNEALNIGACLSTLLRTRYPRWEIILVNDGSEDGTGDIGHALAERFGDELRVLESEPLPDGWSGKSWACWQGYRAARGELLLFTDADTRHDPALLGHAVGLLQRKRADLLSLFPRVLLRTAWERLVLPHLWFIVALRHPLAIRVNRPRKPHRAIVNGQFLLIRRDVYEEIGGHAAERSAVLEDVRIAQRLLERRRRIYLAFAENVLEARLERSFGEALQGLARNLAFGARLTVRPALKAVIPWAVAAFMVGLWLLPPVSLVASFLTGYDGAFRLWALTATAISLLFWLAINVRLRVPASLTLLYPFGALLASLLFVRGALLRGTIEWKGRVYGVTPGAAGAEGDPGPR
jgi:chlorobactene glucosyltransferase